MDETLKRIKRAIIAGRYQFSAKALIELDADGLWESDAIEAILYARDIYKTIRSTSPLRQEEREYLHIIIAPRSTARGYIPRVSLLRAEMWRHTIFWSQANEPSNDVENQNLSNMRES